MALESLRIIKNWFTNSTVAEKNWDEIADNITSYAGRTNQNLKQLGLDISGADYEFNNVGRATQSSSLVARLDSIELAQSTVGSSNLGLNLTTTSIVHLAAADGSALSSTNIGRVTFNSEADAGELVPRQITSDISITLTGAHWGLGTKGDFSDVILWVYLIDLGSGSVVLGVSLQGGRDSILSSDTTTVATSATSAEKVLVSGAVASDSSCVLLCRMRADFDDTGNVGGEDFWSIQTGLEDTIIDRHITAVVGEMFF